MAKNSKIQDKRRYINTKFWTDTWVMDYLNPLDRYLFMYLLTNSRTNIAGAYEISLRQISFETGIEKENLLLMLGRMKEKVEYIDGYIVLKNSDKHQSVENPNIATAVANILNNLPEKTKPKVLAYREGIETPLTPPTPPHLDLDLDSDLDSDSDSDSIILASGEAEPSTEVVEFIPLPDQKQKHAGKQEIDGICGLFERAYGVRLRGKQTERNYAGHLVKRFGYSQARELVEVVLNRQSDKYFVRVSSPSEMWNKLSRISNDLKHHEERKNVKKGIIRV